MDSYEKKYKEMKARVLEIGQGYVKGVDFSKPRQIAEYIDPELKESEDANIRGAIIDYLKDNNLTEWAAWLEKQGEPKSTSWKPTKEQYGALDYAFNCCPDTELGNYFEGVLSNLIDELHKLENQSEQVAIATMDEKPVEEHEPDKVEPIFHEGDWIVFNNHHDSIYQVEKIENYEYTLRHFLGGSMHLSFSHEDMIRAWTLKDAKDGDVLAFKNNIGGIIICKSPTDYDTRSYCRLVNGNLINKEESGWDSTRLVPATKEQRETLEKAMTNAGYRWNKEELKLEKI